MEPTIVSAAIVLALVQVAVKPFVSDSRFYPLASLALGLVATLGRMFAFDVATGPAIYQAVLEGLVVGLTASGAYSGAMTLARRNEP